MCLRLVWSGGTRRRLITAAGARVADDTADAVAASAAAAADAGASAVSVFGCDVDRYYGVRRVSNRPAGRRIRFCCIPVS